MSSIPNHIIDQILLISLYRLLFIGGIFSLIVGIGLIFFSEQMFRTFEKANRWVSCRRATRILEIPHDCWPLIQRYRYILSVFITTGAIFATFKLITQVNMEAIVPSISSGLHLPYHFISWILSSIKYFLILGSVIGIVVGLMLGLSLSTISKIETLSKTWLSTRTTSISKKADAMQTGADQLVMGFPKSVGCIVTVMSIIEVTLVGMQMH